MARITTLAAMRNYIKTMLGSPVITVELADAQLNQIIEDVVQVMNDYHTGEGNYHDYIGFSVSAGTSAYNVSAYNIASTVDFDLFNTNDGLNVLFSETHNILWRDFVLHGNYPGGPGDANGEGMVLAGYNVMTNYLEDVKDTFSLMYHAQYSDARQEFLLTPTPKENGTGLLTVYRKETAENLYNNHIVKNLCIAESKILWGHILGKYSMTLPSGGTINGQDIKSDGKEEKEKIMEQIRMESEPPMFFIE
jgi:hypothetical protein